MLDPNINRFSAHVRMPQDRQLPIVALSEVIVTTGMVGARGKAHKATTEITSVATATKVRPLVRKAANRRHNAIARQSRKANR